LIARCGQKRHAVVTDMAIADMAIADAAITAT
jgi:hypothetical protein